MRHGILFLMICAVLVLPSASFRVISTAASFQSERIPTEAGLRASGDVGGDVGDETRNPMYRLFSTPRDNKPGRCDFFYNDEVVSHLHGYMFLVGGLAAKDEIFFFSFLVYASAAAAATLAEALPANPRVPAAVAMATLLSTLLLRDVVGYEPLLFVEGLGYTGPADYWMEWETAICALNVAWGLWGSWQTKDQTNGATFGF